MKHDPYKTIDKLLEEMAKDKETIRRLELRLAAKGEELPNWSRLPSPTTLDGPAEAWASEAFKLGELFKEEK